MNTEELSRMLAADVTDPPPSTVDIEIAVRTAYRTRRRRLAVAAGAAAAALLVGAGIAGATAAHRSAHGTAPAPAAAPTATPVRAAPTSFDPTVQTVAVGAAGDRMTDLVVQVTVEGQLLSAGYDASSTEMTTEPKAHLSVQVYPRGSAFGARFAGEGRPAAPVHGRPARCLTSAGKPCDRLAFQYLPGAWGTVDYQPVDPDPAAASRARALAETVHLTRPQPMSTPFRLTGRLAGWTPTATSTNRAVRSGRLSLVRPDGSNRYGRYDVDIVVRAHDPERDATNTTVDGCPASLFTDSDGSSGLDVYRPDGTSVSIRTASGVHLDLREVYRAVHLVARPGDFATWVAPLS